MYCVIQICGWYSTLCSSYVSLFLGGIRVSKSRPPWLRRETCRMVGTTLICYHFRTAHPPRTTDKLVVGETIFTYTCKATRRSRREIRVFRVIHQKPGETKLKHTRRQPSLAVCHWRSFQYFVTPRQNRKHLLTMGPTLRDRGGSEGDEPITGQYWDGLCCLMGSRYISILYVQHFGSSIK
jgi:hypothetical protein